MTATQSMREILDQMKLNHAKELQKNRELSEFKRATNPPSQKKSSYEKIPNITPSLNMKKIYRERCELVQSRLDINHYPVQIEVETELCKWCESEIMKGREFCSDRCRGLFVDK